MSDVILNEEKSSAPQAKVKRARRLSAVWIVPLVAAGLAVLLFYQTTAKEGPEIKILFTDGFGLRVDQTVIRYRGVAVGRLEAIELSEDQKHVEVTARLDKTAEFLAREGSTFWIVRPEISIDAVRGLGTIVSGPYIQASPGNGGVKIEFKGAENAPVSDGEQGLGLVLMAGQLGFIKPGSPVYYRGIEVGAVQKHELATNARVVNIYVTIDKPYTPLIRTDTRFWNAGGVDVSFSLFRGLDLSAETFKSLISGGIAFATPEFTNASKPATDGMIFRLYDRPEDSWLGWAPEVTLQLEP